MWVRGEGTEQKKVLYFLFCITLFFPQLYFSHILMCNDRMFMYMLKYKTNCSLYINAVIESMISTKIVKQNINGGNTDIRTSVIDIGVGKYYKTGK